MNNIYLSIPGKTAGSDNLTIATVIETHGSTPQKHGRSALFGPSGLVAGTIGGGVLEGRVQLIAKESSKTKESGIYHFDLDHDISFRQDAICGGEATILLDASPEDHNAIFEQIKESLQNRISGVLVTIVKEAGETDVKIARYWVASLKENNLPRQYTALLSTDFNKLLSSSDHDDFIKHELTTGTGEKNLLAFLEPLFPSFQLVIAGAGHIGKALAHLGKLLDFEVTVIDDREEYANKSNIPDADYVVVNDIGKALRDLRKGPDMYIVIVTRGHDDDAKALKPCINSQAAYLGMIGSKSKIAKMHSHFVQNEWATEEQWSAIHAPIGLEINSKTVEEIAISIAAELVLERNKNKALGTRR
jgi:xanthine dehydrogenase accessory factor